MPGGVNLGNAYGVIDILTDQASRNILGLQKNIGGLNGGLLGLNPALAATGLALGGAAAAAGGLTAAIGYSVNKSADLQEQLSGVKAVTGATNDEISDLRGLIDDLSLDPNLKVSAFEAADAIELLGRNGLKVDEIMGGAANATVLLANATGADFGPAADVATDTMALFNIEAKDMTRAVDGITAVVNNSKFGFDDFRLALAQGGGVAAASGVEFEDFTTSIAAIAPLFASGSDAGTSYKVFLQSLVPKSNDAAEAMKRLGLEFFDAQGNMKDMGEISSMLNAKLNEEFELTVQLGGATKEMVKAAETAKDKIPGLTVKIGEQESQLAILQRELDGTIEKYGDSSVQADKKRLAITKLTNDIDENRAKLGSQQQALDAMTNATVETITTTTQLTEEQRNATLSTIFGTDAMRAAVGLAAQGKVVYTDVAEAAEALGVSMDDLTEVADGGITAFEALQVQMSKTSALDNAATRMDNLNGQVEIMQGVIDAITLGIGDKFLPIATSGIQRFTEFLSANSDAIIEFFGYLADGITTLQDFTYSVLSAVDAGAVIGELGAIFLGINTDIYDTSDAIRDFLFALGLSPDAVDSADALIRTLGEGFQVLVASAKDGAIVVSEFVTALVNGFNEGGLSGAADAFWSWVTGSDGVVATGPGILNTILDMVTGFLLNQWPVISETLRQWGDQFWNWIEEVAIPRAFEELGKLGASMQQWAESQDGSQRLQTLGFALSTALLDGMATSLGNTDRIFDILGALVSGTFAALPSITEGLLSVGAAIAGGVFSGIYTFITGEEPTQQTVDLFSNMWRNTMKILISTLIPAVGLSFAVAQFGSIRDELGKLDFAGLGRSIVEGIAQGIAGGASAIANAAVEAAKSALESAKSILGINSPSSVARDQVGAQFSAGVAAGITDNMAAVRSAQEAALAIPAAPSGGTTSQTNNTLSGPIKIIIQAAENPQETAEMVRAEIERLFDGSQSGSFGYG